MRWRIRMYSDCLPCTGLLVAALYFPSPRAPLSSPHSLLCCLQFHPGHAPLQPTPWRCRSPPLCFSKENQHLHSQNYELKTGLINCKYGTFQFIRKIILLIYGSYLVLMKHETTLSELFLQSNMKNSRTIQLWRKVHDPFHQLLSTWTYTDYYCILLLHIVVFLNCVQLLGYSKL